MGWSDELDSIVKDSKLPANKIKSLSNSLVTQCKKNENYIDYYVRAIDDTMGRCNNQHILNTLYMLDAIMRDLSHISNELMIIFKSRFLAILETHEKKILTMIPEILCPKFIKLLELWINKQFFDVDVLRRWLNRMNQDMSIGIQEHFSNQKEDQNLKRKLNLLDDAIDILMDIDSDCTPGNQTLVFSKLLRNNDSKGGGNGETMIDHIQKKLRVSHVDLTLLDLPNEVLFNIVSTLDITDILRFSFISRFFYIYISGCPFWRRLSFENIKKVSEIHIRSILEQHGYQVTTLCFDFCNFINENIMKSISKHCTTLTNLSLQKCFIQDSHITPIIRKNTLKSLNISQVQSIGHRTTIELYKNTSISKLNISCCHDILGSLFSDPEGYRRVSSSITVLNIDCYCSIPNTMLLNGIHNLLRTTKTIKTIYIPPYSSIGIGIKDGLEIKTVNLWRFVKFNDMPSLKESIKLSKSKLNKRYLNGNTSLFQASEEGKKEMIDLLLDEGADAKITNYDGLSPIMISKDIQTANRWIVKGVKPSTLFEKQFLECIPILEKYYQYLKPDCTLYPQTALPNEFKCLLEVLASDDVAKLQRLSRSRDNYSLSYLYNTMMNVNQGRQSDILTQIKILLACLLKIPIFLKSFLQSNPSSKGIVFQTLGNDDFFRENVMPYLKAYQQKTILLDILESSD